LDDALHASTSIRADVAIINGSGRAFCSGADVRQRQSGAAKNSSGSAGRRPGTNSADLLTRAVN